MLFSKVYTFPRPLLKVSFTGETVDEVLIFTIFNQSYGSFKLLLYPFYYRDLLGNRKHPEEGKGDPFTVPTLRDKNRQVVHDER